MIVIGSAKELFDSAGSQVASKNGGEPLVYPDAVVEIIPAAAIDGNRMSVKVNSEIYFNSSTPSKPMNHTIDHSVSQVLVHFLGSDEKNISKFLDKEPRVMTFMQNRLESSNIQIVLLERGFIDRAMPTIEESLEEKRKAISNIISVNESGDARDFFS